MNMDGFKQVQENRDAIVQSLSELAMEKMSEGDAKTAERLMTIVNQTMDLLDPLTE